MLHSFGLDISDHSLKLAYIRPTLFGFQLVAYAHAELTDGIVVEGEIKNESALSNQIQTAMKQSERPITTPYVALSIPDQKTFTKLLLVPENSSPTEEWVMSELERHIPIPKDELIVDWFHEHTLTHRGYIRFLAPVTARIRKSSLKLPTKNKKVRHVLIVAAEKKIVEQYVSLIHSSGLIPVAFETEAEAIVRSLLISPKATTVQAIIDLGDSQTKIIYLEGGAPLFILTLPLGGRKLSQLIAEKLSIPLPEADQAKMICGFDEKKCHGVVANVLTHYVDALGKAVADATAFYEEHVGGTQPLSDVFLTGGNAAMYQLPERLAIGIHVSVSYGNPMARIRQRHPTITIPKRDTLRYTTAIGLALRGMV